MWHLTKHLRVIPNAWHISFALGFVITVVCLRFCGSVAHTLMRRYML
ncbi:DUF3265 domain-containing protein [Vibrio vulnificus]|nr:DUF3265 domain-containing protein [Vibrio vulnificus]